MELRADSYIFGISRAWRMGAACMVIENQTFCIYAPPCMYLYQTFLTNFRALYLTEFLTDVGQILDSNSYDQAQQTL